MSIGMYAIAASLLALLYGVYLIQWILKLPAGEGKMKGIALAIQEGANAYMARQYKMIALIGVIVFVLLYTFLGATLAIGFLVGAILSGVTGYIGMGISVRIVRSHGRRCSRRFCHRTFRGWTRAPWSDGVLHDHA